MATKKFTQKHAGKTAPPQADFSQQQAKAMHQLLNEIHCGLKDKNRNKIPMKIPSIEFCWMLAIENYLPKQKQIIHKYFKKKFNHISIKK